MAKLTESHLRKIIKEELKKILSEQQRPIREEIKVRLENAVTLLAETVLPKLINTDNESYQQLSKVEDAIDFAIRNIGRKDL